MTDEEKATLAKRVIEDWHVFHDALLQKFRYPEEKFYAFAAAARQYAEAIRDDKFIRRC